MNLIDIYVTEVGNQLNRKNRSDIEAEIRSTLQDMLDERSMKTGKAVDDELILEILQELGSPEKVASSYHGERYLIGPRLFPSFIKVVQIVLPILGVLVLVGVGFSLSRSQPTLGSVLGIIGQALNRIFGAMISAIGSITIIFALLEKFVPDLKAKQTQWDAHTLLKISPPDRIMLPELMVELFFSGLAILIFNFFPKVIGFTPSLNGVVEGGNWQDVTFIPILSDAFFRYIPWLTAIWILNIILVGILVQRSRWEVWTRWIAVFIKALGIGVAIVMLLGPSLVAVDVSTLVATGIHTTSTAQLLVTLVNQAVRLGLILAIFFGSVDLIKLIIRIFRGKSFVLEGNK